LSQASKTTTSLSSSCQKEGGKREERKWREEDAHGEEKAVKYMYTGKTEEGDSGKLEQFGAA
jgi:hypothetical protein